MMATGEVAAVANDGNVDSPVVTSTSTAALPASHTFEAVSNESQHVDALATQPSTDSVDAADVQAAHPFTVSMDATDAQATQKLGSTNAFLAEMLAWNSVRK